ncbi:hypothetical protein EJF36_11550 [Bacillus sp. HMF5848]|uniref:hypothetical protein n=1 Tax=Bacillus sp. HMF5848 TaxID=2495421 RepID=UPI000F7A306E|nr:hypothetical protein [Bacillus sp. HMF5848]RSK27468.1 hypothetical protein EJF36_11550 [Bacillus sp. HMF5848]
MENKQQMTAEVTKKAEELQALQTMLNETVDNLEDAKEKDTEVIVELQEKLEEIEQEKAEATDVTEAKKLQKKAQELQEEIELTKGVNEAKAKQRTAELEDVAQELFAVHKKAVFLYRGLEMEYQATVSVRSLQEDSETLFQLANKINTAFKFARSVLIDFGIITQADSNKNYAGIHLGQRELHTELKRFFNKEAVRQLEARLK